MHPNAFNRNYSRHVTDFSLIVLNKCRCSFSERIFAKPADFTLLEEAQFDLDIRHTTRPHYLDWVLTIIH